MGNEKVKELLVFVKKELSKVSDPTKAAEMKKYLKTEMPMYGIQKPKRAVIEKGMYRVIEKGAPKPSTKSLELYQACVRSLWSMPHREEKYLAIDLAMHYKKFIAIESMDLYEAMLREEYMWWDLCDPISISLVGEVTLNNMSQMKPILNRWIDDDNMWIRRAAILTQLKLKGRVDEEMLFEFCKKRMHETEFFIRKAIGWALREYGKTNPTAVVAFLEAEKSKMSSLSYREGSRILIKEGKLEAL
jgi:3-methyladenine DNA glycosylase AlkD